ncbi:MAG: alpha/beta fold hydrolase [Halioglobus sp.]
MAHGYPASAYLYRYIIQNLCGDEDTQFRCIAMSHVGFGQPSCPGNGSAVGPLYLAGQLQLFIETMQLDDMALVIHDWGGRNWCGVR